MISRDSMRRPVRMSARGLAWWGVSLCLCGLAFAAVASPGGDSPAASKALTQDQEAAAEAVEAPTGFVEEPASSNGFEDDAAFEADRKVFQEVEDLGDGLGPVY